jgi:hypothetical protein
MLSIFDKNPSWGHKVFIKKLTPAKLGILEKFNHQGGLISGVYW